MTDLILTTTDGEVRALHALAEADLAGFLSSQPPALARLAALQDFHAKDGPLPDGPSFPPLPARLPAGDYRLATAPSNVPPERIALAWALGGYRFERYRKKPKDGLARLLAPHGVAVAEVKSLAQAAALARDLINIPANDMGPVELELAAREVAEAFGAKAAV